MTIIIIVYQFFVHHKTQQFCALARGISQQVPSAYLPNRGRHVSSSTAVSDADNRAPAAASPLHTTVRGVDKTLRGFTLPPFRSELVRRRSVGRSVHLYGGSGLASGTVTASLAARSARLCAPAALSLLRLL